MPVSEGQKYKLLVLQVRFLREKLKIHQETFATASSSFSNEYDRLLGLLSEKERNILKRADEPDIQPRLSLQAEGPIDMPVEPKKNMSKKFKKLFREVVKHTHPDKLADLTKEERENKKALFERASQALKANDYAELVDVASSLFLEVEDPGHHEIAKIKASIQETRESIKQIETTVAWAWYHMEKKEKLDYMKNYIQHIYNNATK